MKFFPTYREAKKEFDAMFPDAAIIAQIAYDRFAVYNPIVDGIDRLNLK